MKKCVAVGGATVDSALLRRRKDFVAVWVLFLTIVIETIDRVVVVGIETLFVCVIL